MKFGIKTGIVALLALAAVGCSQTQANNALQNLTAAECDNQSAALANIPLTFITPAQAATVLAGVCVTLYGSAPAPVTAPGNTSVFAPAAPVAAPVVATAPAAK